MIAVAYAAALAQQPSEESVVPWLAQIEAAGRQAALSWQADKPTGYPTCRGDCGPDAHRVP